MGNRSVELSKSYNRYLNRKKRKEEVKCDICENTQTVYYRHNSKHWPKQWKCNNCGRTHDFEVTNG